MTTFHCPCGPIIVPSPSSPCRGSDASLWTPCPAPVLLSTLMFALLTHSSPSTVPGNWQHLQVNPVLTGMRLLPPHGPADPCKGPLHSPEGRKCQPLCVILIPSQSDFLQTTDALLIPRILHILELGTWTLCGPLLSWPGLPAGDPSHTNAFLSWLDILTGFV